MDDYPKNIPAGTKLRCWYPDELGKPWMATVVSTAPRFFGGEQNGILVTVEERGACKCCGRGYPNTKNLTLGHEWFDPKWVKERRKRNR